MVLFVTWYLTIVEIFKMSLDVLPVFTVNINCR